MEVFHVISRQKTWIKMLWEMINWQKELVYLELICQELASLWKKWRQRLLRVHKNAAFTIRFISRIHNWCLKGIFLWVQGQCIENCYRSRYDDLLLKTSGSQLLVVCDIHSDKCKIEDRLWYSDRCKILCTFRSFKSWCRDSVRFQKFWKRNWSN